MKRMIPAVLLVILCSIGRVAGEEWVYYFDAEHKEQILKGKIASETPAGVTISVGRDDKLIAAQDISMVCYDCGRDALPTDFRTADGQMQQALDPRRDATFRHKKMDEAQASFAKLDENTSVTGNAMASRYVKYRLAEIAYRRAMEDSSQRAQALEALDKYVAANLGGWEIVLALKRLSSTYEASGEFDKAQTYLEKLATLADAPLELKNSSELDVSKMLMRAEKYAKAEEHLGKLEKSIAPGDVQREIVKLYRVQCRINQHKAAGADKTLKEVIAGSTDPKFLAVAYNTLGDYYREIGKHSEEAFWAYLRVDTLYPGDVNEHAKALYYLSKLFLEKKLGTRNGDPVRAKLYRDRLLEKTYADTMYYKLATKEK